MKAALLIAVALAALAPAVFGATIPFCTIAVPVTGFEVTASGKISLDGDKPISFKTTKGSEGTGAAKFVIGWKPIETDAGPVCSTTVDKNDDALASSWATARVIGAYSPLAGDGASGIKTNGNVAKQYDFEVDNLEYAVGTGALSAGVNQNKPLLVNYAASFHQGQLLGRFAGDVNVTVDLSKVQVKVPVPGCKLLLSVKTSEVIVKCSTIRLNQLPKDRASGTADGNNGSAVLTGFKVAFAKAPQGAVDFSSANMTMIPDTVVREKAF